MNLTKSLIFDLTKILLPKCLVLAYSLIAYSLIFFHNRVIRINNKCKCGGYAPSNTFYKIEIELLVFKLCPVLFGLSFSNLSSGCSSEWKMNHLKLYYKSACAYCLQINQLCETEIEPNCLQIN